jgi:DNA-binding transcriptional ArsR family regulator
MINSDTAVSALSALAQASRLAIFRLLVGTGPSGMSAGRIAQTLTLAPATLSFHLKELVHAGLLTSTQDGKFIIYRASFDRMRELLVFLEANCFDDSAVETEAVDRNGAAATEPGYAATVPQLGQFRPI